MPRRYTVLFSTIAIGFLWPAFATKAQAVELNLFAGPQSITPGEVIHVTVQSRIQERPIELSYTSDNGVETQTAMTEQGLVSFEVLAQKTVGQMRFMAKAGEGVSNTALVSIFAGPAQNFTFSVKEGGLAGALDISSDVITDVFGNPISDLALVSLDWSDATGLIASQNLQLTRGRLILRAKCPSEFQGALTLQAVINTAISMSSDLSTLCRENSHMEVR